MNSCLRQSAALFVLAVISVMGLALRCRRQPACRCSPGRGLQVRRAMAM